jgi:hypothetical protein
MLSIDTLIMFCTFMILLKFCCSWSYFVGMHANILEKIIYEVELSFHAIGSKFLGCFPLYCCLPLLLLFTMFLSYLHHHRLHLSSFLFL